MADSAGAREIAAIMPTTASQRGVLAEGADADVYVGQWLVELVGPVDCDRLSEAWNVVCARHHGLRSRLFRHCGRVLQVVHRSPPAGMLAVYDLSTLPCDQRRLAGLALCDEQVRAATDPWSGPWAHLAIIQFQSDTVWLCVTHHHIGIDGRSLDVVLDELARIYEGRSRLVAHPATLLDVMRALRDTDRGSPSGGASTQVSQLSTFAPTQLEPVRALARAAVPSASCRASAATHALTPNSVVIAAWLNALAAFRDEANAVTVLSRDRRPAHVPGADRVVGMLTDSVVVALPVQDGSSLVSVGRDVMGGLLVDGPFPLLRDGLREARRAGASGRPDSLLTVYGGGGLPPPPMNHEWSVIEVRETTEFAIDVTIRLDDEVRFEAIYDVTRVGHEVVDALFFAACSGLERPEAICHGGPRRHVTQRLHNPLPIEPDAAGRILNSISAIASRLAGWPVSPDEDLYAAGFDSLGLVELVAVCAEHGYNIRMGELLELGSLTEVARVVAARDRPLLCTTADRSSPDPAPTALERGLLRLTGDESLGREGLHEQSVLMWATAIDHGRMRSAVELILSRLPSLDRCWQPGSGTELRYRGAGQIDFEVKRAGVAEDVPVIARRLTADDLTNSFGPDGGPLLRFRLVTGGRVSALLLSFHCAILDGWSFGTLIRDLQSAYRDPTKDRGLVGRDSGDHRLVSNQTVVDPSRWERVLAGAVPVARPLARWEPRVGAASAPVVLRRAQALAAEARVSESAVIQTAASVACHRVLGMRDEQPIAMRMSLRGGSPHADTQTVGQLTADVPFVVHGHDFIERARSVAKIVETSYEVGHVGHDAFRAALGCGDGELAFDTTIVMENYFRRDERLVRGADRGSWTELDSWRRDVPIAPRAITLRGSRDGLVVEVSSVVDDLPGDVAKRLASTLTILLK